MGDEDVFDFRFRQGAKGCPHPCSAAETLDPVGRTQLQLPIGAANQEVAEEKRELRREPQRELVGSNDVVGNETTRKCLSVVQRPVECQRRRAWRRLPCPDPGAVTIRGLGHAALVEVEGAHHRGAAAVVGHEPIERLPVADQRVDQHDPDAGPHHPPGDLRLPTVALILPVGMNPDEPPQAWKDLTGGGAHMPTLNVRDTAISSSAMPARAVAIRRVLLMSLLVAIAITPIVAAAKKPSGGIPNCAVVSRGEIAKLAQTGHLKLEKQIGNLCVFFGEGEHRGHYKPGLDIQIIPYIKSIWDTAKSDATKSAGKNGDTFGQSSKALFFVTGVTTGHGLQPCDKDLGTPGRGQSKFGPVCATEPDATHISVYGNGTDRRNHLHLMVTAALIGQQGDVHLSHVIQLVKDVISGKIH